MSLVQRWRQFKRDQRDALRASNQPWDSEDTPSVTTLIAEVLTPKSKAGPDEKPPVTDDEQPPGEAGEPVEPQPGPHGSPGSAADSTATGTDASAAHPFGRAGRPINRQSPFYLGFVGAIGVLVALGLWHTVGRLATVITLLVVALFLTLALNPIVEALTRRGMLRPWAVFVVFAGLVFVFALLGLLVVPPVAEQSTLLVQEAPGYVDNVLRTRWVQDIDQHYHVVDKISEEVNKRLTDSNFLGQVAGGVLGAGRAVLTGLFQVFTVLILSLFLLANLPRVKQAAYAVVPASRRPRVISLSEEIMRRTGSYAIGQVAVATVNAICSWIMMSIVGIPYAAVLAVLVGFLGLVPMVGATLGAVLVCTVAVFDEPRKMVIAAVYYVLYQQIENYVVVPRIMQRTVSVPGAVTVVAALAGGTLIGVLGALLAIPFAAGLLLLYEEVLIPRQRRH
jgi:predicted PurR-regulated permease PerM